LDDDNIIHIKDKSKRPKHNGRKLSDPEGFGIQTTPQQREFVKLQLDPNCPSDLEAYRKAYSCTNPNTKTVRSSASRVAHHPAVKAYRHRLSLEIDRSLVEDLVGIRRLAIKNLREEACGKKDSTAAARIRANELLVKLFASSASDSDDDHLTAEQLEAKIMSILKTAEGA